MAGHTRGDAVETVFQRSRRAVSAQFGGEVFDEAFDVRLAEQRRRGSDRDCAFAEAFENEPEFGKLLSAALKQFAYMYLSAVPDLHHEIEDQFSREDGVVSRMTARGTHRGEMMGIAPTGKPITFSMFIQHRIADGKIVEEWISYDLHAILQQVGALG